MQEKIINPDNKEKTAHEKLARHYLSKYAKELQVHFNLSDCTLKKIIANVSADLKCENCMKKFWKQIKDKFIK